MAFDSLSEKLQNVFKNLRGKGRLTEADVKAALKEVKLALLEADVSFKVVKQFIKAVEERAVGTDVLESLTPGQTVIKIVHEEMIRLMGTAEEIRLKPSNEITVMQGPAGSLRCVSSGSDQAASGQRREAGRGSLFHGRSAQAGQYRESCRGACEIQRHERGDSGYSRTASYR